MDSTLVYTLNNMGIYDLRNFARSVGVSKPTTLKRQELINAILGVKSGEIEPKTGLNRGRKPKNKESAVELFKKYSNDFIDYTKTLTTINTTIETNMPRKDYVFQTLKTKETTYFKTGIVTIENEDEDGFYITENNEKISIPNLFIKKFNIKDKDSLSATCILKDEQFVVVSVLDRPSVIGKKFEELQTLYKTKKLNFNSKTLETFNKNFNINYGQCVEINYDQKSAPEKVVLEVFNAIKKPNLEIFALLTDEFNNPQITKEIERLKMIRVLDELETKKQNIKDIVLEIKQYVENAQNCVLFIGNISLLITALKEFYILCGNNETISKTLALKEIMEILTLARQTESGSITILTLNAQNNIEELKPLFNARLSFECINASLSLNTNSYSIY